MGAWSQIFASPTVQSKKKGEVGHWPTSPWAYPKYYNYLKPPLVATVHISFIYIIYLNIIKALYNNWSGHKHDKNLASD